MLRQATHPATRHQFGVGVATALVVGNMVGSGVFLLPASLAPYHGLSLVGWGFTAVGALLLAYLFSRLAHAYPRTGGPYAYSRRAFGDFIGFQTAWGYWVAAWLGNVVIATGFVSYLGHFWGVAAGSSTTDHVTQAGVAVAAIWALTLVNVAGLRQSGLVQAATTVLKMIPLMAVAFAGIFWIHSANIGFHPSTGSNFSAINSSAALVLWAFIGFESATVPAESIRDPQRNIRRATLYGTALTAVTYVLGTAAVLGLIAPEKLGSSTAPFADAATNAWGGWAGDVVAVGAIVATFGCLNGWILLQGQMPYAAARDLLFPKAFGRLTRRGVPAFGIVTSSVLITLAIIPSYNSSTTKRFTDFVLLATTTTLVAYLYGVAAHVMLLVSDPKRLPSKNLRWDAFVGLLGTAYAVWLLYGAGYRYAAWAFFFVVMGLPIYVWQKYEARKLHPELVHPEAPDYVELPDQEEVTV